MIQKCARGCEHYVEVDERSPEIEEMARDLVRRGMVFVALLQHGTVVLRCIRSDDADIVAEVWTRNRPTEGLRSVDQMIATAYHRLNRGAPC